VLRVLRLEVLLLVLVLALVVVLMVECRVDVGLRAEGVVEAPRGLLREVAEDVA